MVRWDLYPNVFTFEMFDASTSIMVWWFLRPETAANMERIMVVWVSFPWVTARAPFHEVQPGRWVSVERPRS